MKNDTVLLFIWRLFMPSIARVSDAHACPRKGHSINAVVSGSSDVIINGIPAARVGDTAACGAMITTGSCSVFINGKPAAFMGSATSHGGIIIGGSPNVLIGEYSGNSAKPLFDHPAHSFDQSMMFICGETGSSLDGLRYLATMPGKKSSGTSCSQGCTNNFSSEQSEQVDLYLTGE